MSCFPSPDSSRRGMSWIFCRKSAPRPEPRSAQEPRGLAPFSRLFRFSASVDHQMTPALFRPLFRASPFRGLHWRTGCRARLRRPSDLKHHAACREGGGLGLSVGPRSPAFLFRWPSPFRPSSHSECRSPFALFATRTAATGHIFELRKAVFRDTARPFTASALPGAPLARSASPGNRTLCKPSLRTGGSRRTRAG